MNELMTKFQDMKHEDLYRMSSSELSKQFGRIIQESSLSEVSELFDKVTKKFTGTEVSKKEVKRFILGFIERKARLIRESL